MPEPSETIYLEYKKDCDSIMFYKWAKRCKCYEKSLFMLSGIQAPDLLEEQITYLHAHYYWKYVQPKEYTRQVHELSKVKRWFMRIILRTIKINRKMK